MTRRAPPVSHNRLETARLYLALVPLAGLAATAARKEAVAKKIIGDRLPAEWFEQAWVFGLRRDQWLASSAYAPWSIRAIALKHSGQIIGTMNCHRAPAPFRLGAEVFPAVEMGYEIFPAWQRQGYALEAITGFLDWAGTQGLGGVLFSIAPDNAASRGLAEKLGATKIDHRIDPDDGPEDIFLLRLVPTPRRTA